MKYMKKIFSLILLFGLFVWFSIAGTSIWDVSMSFCNTIDWNSGNKIINFVAQAGQPYEICIELRNSSLEKIPISFSFVDWEITNDSLRNKACSNQWNVFAQYVDFESDFVELEPWEVFQKTGSLVFPLWYSGEINGCFVYMIPDNKKKLEQWWSFFDVVVRRANFIDWYVVGDFKRNIEFNDFLVDYYIDKKDGSLVVNLKFNNWWVLPEYLQYTWRLSNMLGYERFFTSSKVIDYWTSSLVEFRFADIPFYKGVYNFFFQWSSVLDTRLDLSYVPEKYKQKIDFSYDKNIVIVPWILILWVLWFFVALFALRWILKVVLRR